MSVSAPRRFQKAGRPAPTRHSIHPLLAARWSPRAFASDETVSSDQLHSILEAARWAPSSFNEQPWRFVVGTREEPEFLSALQDLLMEGNSWARAAPVLILSAYTPTMASDGSENRVALRDLGAAEENLVLQAFDLGLVTHQMGGFDVERARNLLPDDLEPGSMIAVGPPGDPEDLPDPLQEREERPRRRRPLDALVSLGQWDDFRGPDDG
jgi:nitroreductase